MYDTMSLLPLDTPGLREQRPRYCRVLFVFFLAGLLIGMIRGRFFLPDWPRWVDIFPARFSGEADLLWVLWASSWIVFVVLAFSSSFLGCLFIPMIFFFSGWMLAAQMKEIASSGGADFLSLLRFSFPVFLFLSALFLIGEESLEASAELFRLIRFPVRGGFRGVSGERLILSFFLLLLSVVSRRYLLPLLS